ncbi:hypothetical protein TURU_123060 [Turdus rufiventris]|nr:hypothetical protein TURU_123060 [Turdus rufiventris]
MVTTLGKVVAAVGGSDGDVLLTGSSEALWRHLDPFINHLDDNLHLSAATDLGNALARLQATPRPTWDSVESTPSSLVAKVVGEWRKLVSEASKLLDACSVTADTLGGTAAAAAKAARDLQKKVEEWLNSVDNLVAKSRCVPVVTDKEKEDSASKKYKAELGEAKEKTLVALQAMEEAVVFLSQVEAAVKRGRRAEVALGPLEGLVTACAATTVMFQELRCRVGDIEAKLEGTKEESPDVPKDLVAEAVQLHQLWRASGSLYTRYLGGIVEDIRKVLPSGIDGSKSKEMAKNCQDAIKDIPKLLQRKLPR